MKLMHIQTIKKADGRVFRYYRRAGKVWGSLTGAPGSAEFIQSYGRLHTLAERELSPGPPPLPEGTFSWLCAAYFKSPEFDRLAKTTQETTRVYLGMLDRAYGDRPFAAIDTRFVRDLRRDLSAKPAKANRVIACLRAVLEFALNDGLPVLFTRNPAAGIPKLGEAKRTAVWTQEEEEAWLEWAGQNDPEMKLAFRLAAYTAQRQADIRALTWNQFIQSAGGRFYLKLRQRKTGVLLDVPCHMVLAQALLESPRAGVSILLDRMGKPFTKERFCERWRAASQAAGVEGKQMRDLRRTAMVRMSEAGATTQQVAAVSGHSIAATQTILDTYIVPTTKQAEGAILALERGPK